MWHMLSQFIIFLTKFIIHLTKFIIHLSYPSLLIYLYVQCQKKINLPPGSLTYLLLLSQRV